MTEPSIIRLYPTYSTGVALRGVYLQESLHSHEVPGRTFVYTNFVSSIDGRVAVADDVGTRGGVPAALANRNDWRLYQELAAQADVIITSGRYVRETGDGVAGPLLTFGEDPAMADVARWRAEWTKAPMPAIAVVSRALDFDLAAASEIGGQVVALGSAACPPERVRELEDAGVTVVTGRSPTGLSGTEIAVGLFRAGYRVAFSAAGPALAHTLLEGRVLDRLYVTQVLEILGGRDYFTLNEGPLLPEPVGMKLRSLLFDEGDGGPAQLFASYSAA